VWVTRECFLAWPLLPEWGMATQSTSDEGRMREHFLELLQKFDTGTLVTHGRDGQLHGRPMSVARKDKDGELWFLTSADSGKVSELTRDERALVSFADSDRFVVVDGVVETVQSPDIARALWKEPFRLWFTGPDDPKLVVLRFAPTSGEYWNNAGAQGVKYAFRAAKAYIKGEQLKDAEKDVEQHGVVQR
jgi:general stress protein 26